MKQEESTNLISDHHTTKPDIAFVCGELPYPPINGMRIPSYYMITLLLKYLNLAVIVITDDSDENIAKNKTYFNKLGIKFFYVLKKKKKLTKLKKLLKFLISFKPSYIVGAFDKVVAENLNQKLTDLSPKLCVIDAEYLAPYYQAIPNQMIKIISPNDSMSLAFYNELHYKIHQSKLKHLLVYLNYRKSKRFEAQTYPLFDCCHFVSEVDASYIRALNSSIKTLVVSNGVDVDYFSTEKKITHNQASDLLFVGGLTGGNLIYIERFIKEVWQAFKAQVPSASLTIVSRIKPDIMQSYEHLGVNIIGGVDDLRVVYEKYSLILTPVLKNCGILNKVLEGMAMSRVVIGYSVGFYGIPEAKDKLHYLAANNPKALLDVLVNTAQGAYQLSEIADNARVLMDKHYRWQHKIDQLYQYLSTYLNQTS
ncbi:MAG: glycosyltransferase [Gammaproteobacteria bacterium]|nr:MAG: glycosyltransferase [Gammaproteobacteria bacterium]UTW42497.1 glycosyltransferase [bacterium SCSIO 12844]